MFKKIKASMFTRTNYPPKPKTLVPLKLPRYWHWNGIKWVMRIAHARGAMRIKQTMRKPVIKPTIVKPIKVTKRIESHKAKIGKGAVVAGIAALLLLKG